MKIQRPQPTPNAPYQKMYVTLFKAITASLDMMENGEFMNARAVLIQAQQQTEELYIDAEQ